MVVKILLSFFALYLMACAIFLGVALFFILKDFAPKEDPLEMLNNLFIFWLLLDLKIRFFLQKTPAIHLQPMLILPLKKSNIIHFLLRKTIFSFFNILPLFFLMPFCLVLLLQEPNQYPTLHVVAWLISLIAITQVANFTNILIDKSNVYFFGVLGLLMTLIALEYFDIYKASVLFGHLFNALYHQPYFVFIPLGIALFLYRVTHRYFLKRCYLDAAFSKAVKQVKTADLSWANRFGGMGVFLKNDLRMIVRNKRPQQALMTACLVLFYGLLCYTHDQYVQSPILLPLVSVMLTAGFLLSFGQRVPSWDSPYYKMMMSQNIPYRKYLASKWYLMVLGILISFILCTPYLYFGWKIYLVIVAGAFFNMGANTLLTLLAGAFNTHPLALNQKAVAFANTKAFSASQLLLALPQLGLPMLLYYVPYKVFDDFLFGTISLGGTGIAALMFKNYFLNRIEKLYQKRKYKTIAAFSKKP